MQLSFNCHCQIPISTISTLLHCARVQQSSAESSPGAVCRSHKPLLAGSHRCALLYLFIVCYYDYCFLLLLLLLLKTGSHRCGLDCAQIFVIHPEWGCCFWRTLNFCTCQLSLKGPTAIYFWTINAENSKERKQITDLKDIQKVILDLIFRFKSVKMLWGFW